MTVRSNTTLIMFASLPPVIPINGQALENEGYFGIGVKKENNTASASGHVYLTGKEAVNYQSYGWGFLSFSN